VDPETLEWENIGRHELGAGDIDNNKAVALAAHLGERLPLTSCVGIPEDWREAVMKDPSFFADTDLVVSLTAEWGSDAALNDLLCAGELPCPVVFGWMERDAAAAHGLILNSVGPCLRCGFDETGNALVPATSWLAEMNDPRCAAPVSPYGAIELSSAQGVVATMVIDFLAGRLTPPIWRVWLGRSSALENGGGYWSKEFVSIAGDPKEGGRLISAPWGEGSRCAHD
jgi:hypothetical protein